MANASPCMPSGAMAQVFFPPGGSSLPISTVIQQGSPITVAPVPVQGTFPAMDLSSGQGPGGVVMPSLPPAPAGVSFIIQIGLTRESVLMPLSADLAYVKQIACSIVDTKVGGAWVAGSGESSHEILCVRLNGGIRSTWTSSCGPLGECVKSTFLGCNYSN